MHPIFQIACFAPMRTCQGAARLFTGFLLVLHTQPQAPETMRLILSCKALTLTLQPPGSSGACACFALICASPKGAALCHGASCQ